MGANQRGQGTDSTHRAIVSDIGLLVMMPGVSGTHGQQKQDAQQDGDTGKDARARASAYESKGPFARHAGLTRHPKPLQGPPGPAWRPYCQGDGYMRLP